MDSDLYMIKVLDTSKTFNEVMDEHELGLSSAIVEKIAYAIDHSLTRINIAKIDTGKITITLHASIKNYEDTLQSNINNLIKYEAYELCSIGVKALERFKESNQYKKYLGV